MQIERGWFLWCYASSLPIILNKIINDSSSLPIKNCQSYNFITGPLNCIRRCRIGSRVYHKRSTAGAYVYSGRPTIWTDGADVFGYSPTSFDILVVVVVVQGSEQRGFIEEVKERGKDEREKWYQSCFSGGGVYGGGVGDMERSSKWWRWWWKGKSNELGIRYMDISLYSI